MGQTGSSSNLHTVSRRRCCWSPAGPASSDRTCWRALMRPAVLTLPSMTFSVATANGAISPDGSLPISFHPRMFCNGLRGANSTPSSISAPSLHTTATDGDLVIETNFRLSFRLFEWCAADPYAVHLRILGRDLWRRRGRFSATIGRSAAATAETPQSLRLEQAFVRSGGRRTRRQGSQTAAAMGRD